MAFVIRKHAELTLSDEGRKVIKAENFWVHKQARAALVDAQERAAEILDSARTSFENERRRGYEAGLAEARQENAADMASTVARKIEYLSRVESQLVELVLDTVRRVMGQVGEREAVLGLVKQSLGVMRGQASLTLRLHPAGLEAMQAQVAELVALHPSVQWIDVVGDAGVAADACTLESDIGVVEASVSGQLEALRAAFARVFGPQ